VNVVNFFRLAHGVSFGLTPWARHSSLSRPQCCIRHNWPLHSPQSSHFQFRHHGFHSQLTGYILSLQQVFLSHFRLLFLFHITFILWCSPRLCLGPILLTIYVPPMSSIVSSLGVNQQQYADDTQLFVFLSPLSLSSSLCSLQRYLFSSQLVLNSTKTEAICLTPAHDSNRFTI